MLVREVEVRWDRVVDPDRHPFDVPFVRNLGVLRFEQAVTFLVGDNGSGKSTLVEGIATALDLNPEGGTGSMTFQTTDRPASSDLGHYLRMVHRNVHRNGSFFLRAESFFNVATAVDRYDIASAYSERDARPRSLHERSHGESFLAFALHRWIPGGLYLLDEPESALSFHGQLQMLRIIHELAHDGSQFIIATHSPILTALPGAAIIECTPEGPQATTYDDAEFVNLNRSFLQSPYAYLRHLLLD